MSVRPGEKAIQSEWRRDADRAERSGAGRFQVGRMERIGEEGVLDVSGDEFLVLLLVLQAEGDAAEGFGLAGNSGASSRRAMAALTWAR